MSDDIAIKIDSVSKKYCKSLKRSMYYGVKDIAKNTFGMSSRSDRLRKGEFWALDDISLEIKKGETLGVIGPNGAGKTTLLKLLNGIFWPDKGKISIRGKVGALIEVGAGFHPLLTGRENIYLNGSILGMTKDEITSKFDEIVEFADIGDFIDVPVKNYSSGMYVRLGFAVAVHCDPDVLLIDEVLAVGDSAFRNKCLVKIRELENRGVTIVFVSHNLLDVERYCDKGILLESGNIVNYGAIDEVINEYQIMINQLSKRGQKIDKIVPGIPYCTKKAEISDVRYLGENEREKTQFSQGDRLGIRIEYRAHEVIHKPIFQVSLFNKDGIHVSVFGTHMDGLQLDSIQNMGAIECWINDLPLLLSKYYVTVTIVDEAFTTRYDYWNGALQEKYFQVLPNIISKKMGKYTPIFQITSDWKVIK